MTDAASTTASAPSWTRWLNPALAITGIAVGIFIIVAGIYLVFWQQPSGYAHMMTAGAPTAQSMDCCASMMKGMKMPAENKPGMPSTPNMPTPAPGR